MNLSLNRIEIFYLVQLLRLHTDSVLHVYIDDIYIFKVVMFVSRICSCDLCMSLVDQRIHSELNLSTASFEGWH